MNRTHTTVAMIFFMCGAFSQAQQTMATNATVVPPLVRFNSALTDGTGEPLSGVVGVTFYLYREQTGGSPLWLETQNVQADSGGRYTVMLGSTSSQGLPSDVFSSGQARWLGVQIEGQEEQPRVMLLSVPYAMKAGDAQTINGLPASAFVLAAPGSPGPSNPSGSGPTDAGTTAGVVGSGTADFIPLWTANSILGNSALFQSGSGSTATVGLNTTTPAATLDVNGSVIARGPLQLPSTGTATAGGGFNSQPFSLQGSSFNSGTSKAIGPLFQWQTEPSGNNTSNPSGTLNLLYGNGSGSPAETGLRLSSGGIFTFAAGQTFPGTGTITGVTTASGSGLTGGGTSGTINLALTNTCSTAQVLQWNGGAWICSAAGTISGVTAGTDLTGGGTSGAVTLNLDTTKVPQLNTANNFNGNQQVTGNLTTTGSITAEFGNFDGTYDGPLLNVLQTGTGDGAIITASTGYAGLYVTGFDIGVNATASCTTCGGVAVNANSTSGTAVLGVDSATTGLATGVFGQSASTGGYGVQGASSYVGVYGQSGNGTTFPFFPGAGVWGATSSNSPFAVGVEGTANDSSAGYFQNNTGTDTSAPTVYTHNFSTTKGVLDLEADGQYGLCTIDNAGDLNCTGGVKADVAVEDGARRVSLYATQSTENWFEDAGSGQLSSGSARIDLDPTFAQTVNTGVEYHVFLTPKGDCEGLYVTNETSKGFEVHELRGGTSNIGFDYRIMAKRSGFENVRLADVTDNYRRMEEQDRLRREHMEQRRAERAAQPSAALPIAQASK
jgi:hypothetical protein